MSAAPKPVAVEVLPTRVWIEEDLFGRHHVMLQHEGVPEFTYCTLNYQYGYTDNASVRSASEAIAVSLGAVEPVERKHRASNPAIPVAGEGATGERGKA